VLSEDELHQARSVSVVEVAQRHGAKLRREGRELIGACPHCGGDDRFAVWPAKNIWHCRGCGTGGDPIKLEMHLGGRRFFDAVQTLIGKDAGPTRRHEPTPEEIVARAAREAERRREEAEEAARNASSVAKILARLQPVAGTAGETYLRDIRKLDTDHWAIRRALEDVETLGWCERTYFRQDGHELDGQMLGAIVAILTDPVSGARTGGITRTYLYGGAKVCRAKSLGGVGRLGIIRLSPDDEVGEGLHLCEGLETALSGMSDPRMNFLPMWAAGSTATMEAFPVLAGVECLTIPVDNDENEASLNAASAVYWRWKDAGRDVHIRQPKERGDLNDIVRRAR
jgi:putative DNA primase/helicase